MIRKALEKKVGPVTDVEWKWACRIAQLDILVNNWLFRKRTSHQYLATVLVTAVNIVRRYHEVSAANL